MWRKCQVLELKKIAQCIGAGKIDDQTVQFIVKHCPNLKFLDLSCSHNVSDTGVLEIAKLSKLKGLDLSATRATDKSMPELAKLQQLQYLNLKLTKVGDEGMQEVAKLPKLEYLNIEQTQVGDAGFNELVNLPPCRSGRKLL